MPREDLWAAAALAATGFAVYMSLVPLDFRPLTWPEALERMGDIRFLDLGVYSRADWVANGVVFAPIGFLWCAALTARPTLHRPLLGAFVCAMCVALAYVLEYTQVFFRGRTTSFNDIYAEIIGGIAGVVMWLILGRHLTRLLDGFAFTFVPAARALLVLYLGAYVLINLFPYDVLLSLEELSDRFVRAPPTLFPAPCNEFRCAADLFLEVGATIPLGLLVLLVPWRARPSHLRLFAIGAGFGLALEAAQALTYSGTVQGVSVATRGLGIVLGRMLAEVLANAGWPRLAAGLRPAALAMLAPYALALAYGNHWTWTAPLGLQAIWAAVMEQSWIPFHYYYIGPEVFAVQKLIYQSAMYAPAGVLLWALTTERATAKAWIAPATGLTLAAVMGLGRIATYPGIGPDPTNLLIAAIAAYLGYRAAVFFGELAAGDHRASSGARPPYPVLLQRLAASVVAIVTLVLTASYPFAAAGNLTLGLVLYALAVHRWPRLWLAAFPIGIALLDRAPSTGILLLNEFDLFVLTTVAVLLWRIPFYGCPRQGWGSARWLLGGFLAVIVLAAFHGWSTLGGASPTSITRIDGSDNVWLRLKSFLLVVPLLPYLVAALKQDERAVPGICLGWAIGLGVAAATLIWERHVFTGVFDAETPFRASGPFSAMATGGAALDLYLVIAVPFAVHMFLFARQVSPGVRILAGVACLLGLYALLVTYTRATYAAAGIAFTVLFVGSLTASWQTGRRGTVLLGGAVLTLLLAGLGLASTSGYMGLRFHTAFDDIPSRAVRLTKSVELGLDHSPILGAGTGTFPALNIASRPAEARPGRAVIVKEGRRHHLQLHGGSPIYFDQRVKSPIGNELAVTLRSRSASNAPGEILVCLKHLMNSRACTAAPLPADGSNRWRTHTVLLDTRTLSTVLAENPLARSAVYLTLTPPRVPGATIAVTRLALDNAKKQHQLVNGSFDQAQRGWFFTQDDHTLWHLKNLWASLLFELGFPGAGLFLALTLYLAIRTVTALGAQRAGVYPIALAGLPAATLAALSGLHVVGLTDGVFDAPRLGAAVLFLYGITIGISAPLRALVIKEEPAWAPQGYAGTR